MHQNLDLSSYENVYVVGDIHGNWDVFNFALETLGFSEKDFIVGVGDLIDRGTQNIECLTFFLNTENAISVRGNHEDMMIKGILENNRHQAANWIYNGGGWMLDFPLTYIKALAQEAKVRMPLTLTVTLGDTKVGVCHAECPTESWGRLLATKDYQILEDIVWGRNKVSKQDNAVITGVDYTVHGHTPNKEVVQKCNQYWIDTAIASGVALTISEMKPEGLVHHRFIRNADERSGFEMVY